VAVARTRDARIAVLAVDPTSPYTGGALLGDRVRMQEHATDPDVFVRSMATRGHLGGMALAAPEAVRILDASGYDVVLVETVGVGQAEVDVAAATDTAVVVLAPGLGDAVQMAKAGILEVADTFVVNKGDREGAGEVVRELRQMLHLGVARDWEPPVLVTTATERGGVEELWEAIDAHRAWLGSSGVLEAKRGARLRAEVEGLAAARFRVAAADQLEADAALVGDLAARRTDPYRAADLLAERVGARRRG
jgi:LAO/AO transport system kinase